MNLEISTGDYLSTSAFGHRRGDPLVSSSTSTLPHPSVMLKKDPEPWRAPSTSSFGLANLLNRSASSSASGSASAGTNAPSSLPKFSLPSLTAFNKPLLTRPDPSMHHSRSILSESGATSAAVRPHEGFASPSDALLQSQNPSQGQGQDRDASPPTTSLLSRRIAPAPLDDDDVEIDDGPVGSDSIRGGRWSTDEHDRFLAGFRIHGHKWKRVQQVVRTRSVTQVRTHAQKYLLKLAKLKAEKKPDGTLLDDDQEPRPMDSASDTDVSMSQSGMDEYEMDAQSQAMAQAHAQAQAQALVSSNAGPPSYLRSPLKKPRRHNRMASVEEEYIAAAASTLCFLMRQKIDSIVERPEDDRDLEPYDCYSSQTTEPSTAAAASRKRPYMHFITDTSDDYSYGEQSVASETTACAIEGKPLCSS